MQNLVSLKAVQWENLARGQWNISVGQVKSGQYRCSRISRTAMWRTFLTLALASACLALPSPQQNNGNLDGLIENIFDSAPNAVSNPAPQRPTTPSAVSKPAGNTNFDAGISSIFLDPHSTTPTTIQDTQNNASPQSCKCVPYYECSNGTIIVDGIGLLNLRS